MENALENPTPSPRGIGREIASGILEGIEGYLAEEGQGERLGQAGVGFAHELVPVLSAELRQMAPTSRLIFEESGRGLVDGLTSRREELALLMGDIADDVGRAMARAMAEQFRAELRQQLDAPPDPALAQAVEGVAYRSWPRGLWPGVSTPPPAEPSPSPGAGSARVRPCCRALRWGPGLCIYM